MAIALPRPWPRALLSGTKSVKIHGMYVDVNAEIASLDSFSAHADQEGLLQWLDSAPSKPKGVLLVHGEPAASDELRRLVGERLHVRARVPELGDTLELRGRSSG